MQSGHCRNVQAWLLKKYTSIFTGALKSRSREGTGFSGTSVSTNSCSVSVSSNTFVVAGSADSPCLQPKLPISTQNTHIEKQGRMQSFDTAAAAHLQGELQLCAILA